MSLSELLSIFMMKAIVNTHKTHIDEGRYDEIES